MKKIKSCLILILIIIGSIFIYLINKKEYLSSDDIIGVYVNNELSEDIPSKDEALFQKAICDNDNVKVSWDSDNWGLLISNMNTKVKCNLYFYSGQTVFNFDYTGSEQTFTAPISGTYKLETWGAQGGKINGRTAGTGGYSSGFIKIQSNQIMFINIGGQGEDGENYINNENTTTKPGNGGYNGGGTGQAGGYYSAGKYTCAAGSGGGGATHIALSSGLLSSLENHKEQILMVSGGGGGISGFTTTFKGLGHAGGYSAFSNLSNKINQSYGYAFGLGETIKTAALTEGCGGGGGGYYGGICDDSKFGTGGSSYIGNPLLKNKVMYCYNCEESSEENIKTISTICSEETPTSNCSKKSNGYARITLVSIDE